MKKVLSLTAAVMLVLTFGMAFAFDNSIATENGVSISSSDGGNLILAGGNRGQREDQGDGMGTGGTTTPDGMGTGGTTTPDGMGTGGTTTPENGMGAGGTMNDQGAANEMGNGGTEGGGSSSK